jgi:hypothetical protein
MKGITTWEYSVDTETERILHTAHQIIVGFYKTNNFVVLPKKVSASAANLVIFPDLNYQSILKFWKMASKIDIYTTPFTINPILRLKFKELLSKTNSIKPEYEKVMKLWSKAENEVLNEISRILPDKKSLIKKVTIYPTTTGTSCSFSLNQKGGEMIIYLRDDQGIHAITEAIITSLTREDIYDKLDGIWQESEIITDFLVTQTSIAKVLQKYEKESYYTPTLKGTRHKDSGNLNKLSEEYYKKLNIPNFNNPFSLNGLTPEINKEPIQNLTQNEKQIMYLLIKNSNNTVSFDEVSDIIFKDDTKFSLFALAKVMQRLREKLEKNGISGSFIQTVRGKGYLLKN